MTLQLDLSEPQDLLKHLTFDNRCNSHSHQSRRFLQKSGSGRVEGSRDWTEESFSRMINNTQKNLAVYVEEVNMVKTTVNAIELVHFCEKQ